MIGAEILDTVGSDIDKCYQNEDWNALHFTASIGDSEVVKTLLSDGANADCQSKVGIPLYRPLHGNWVNLPFDITGFNRAKSSPK